MEICPLKHEIRKSLWERFARAVVGSRGLRSYLTLFSPAMMDIKHFHRCGLLDFSENVYKGVVAVTNDDDAYNEGITGGRGRPELIVAADIDRLLIDPKEVPPIDCKRFREQFPFQVVNLDYTNSIFFEAEKREVSRHLEALHKLVDLQRSNGANSFALFLTTTAEQGTIASHFLDVLGDRVATNLRLSRDFATRFHSTYGGQTPDQLRATHYDEFVPLGLAKFVTNLLSDGQEISVACFLHFV